ncbi:sterol desaturase family protein [Paraburkholderia sp. Tr-20389]|uniref:sterol desaturase family protein n=1 Tax=Paraburkholderia sp. Tr-20389 TaxID=2703903 RepID=UPI001F11B6C6|nr:sterol desaturase family protein [Paraburkholderia sp. Tr-20389]
MALPLLGMLACMLAELLVVQRWRGRRAPWRDLVLNLDSGHILMWLFRGVEISVYAWVVEHANLHWADHWSPLLLWGSALLAWDLGFYWMHRLHHVLPALWSVHVVHHEGEHFNLSLGVRNAWLSSLTTLPFTSIPLALVGVPVPVFVAVSTLHYTVQFYNHNSIVGRSGWLERFFVTPSHHRVHHGQNREYRDRNYGGTFLIWDKLFGSFQRELPDVPVRYGVARPTASTNPFWANIVPLLRYAGARVPGFRHDERRKTRSDITIGTGGALLFCVAAYYIHRDGTWPAWGQPLFFMLIFALTLALGGMSDGRPWGLPCWLFLGCTGIVILPLLFGLNDPIGLVALALLPLHGVMTSLFDRADSVAASSSSDGAGP